MISKILVVLVLGPLLLYNITESCGRVPVTPKPTTLPPPTSPRATLNDSVRNLQCTANETSNQGCLNGGTCFVLVLEHNVRETSCQCMIEYRGLTCEELNIDVLVPSIDGGGIATAGIAASLAVLIVIIIVLTGVTILYCKRKRERQRAQEVIFKPVSENGKLPENHTPPRPSSMHLSAGNRNSFYLNGNTSSNGNSGFLEQGRPNTETGSTETDFKEKDTYPDISYMDEVDEKTPMYRYTDTITGSILNTKTTSV